MKGITWLASYPKSGNTWMRVFLTNLRRNAAAPANINDLDPTMMASDRDAFDRAVGYDMADLTADEVEALWPDVYVHLASQMDAPSSCKVHAAYTYLPDGRALFPPAATLGALYMVRNPLDVCISLAHHEHMSRVDRAIAVMGDPQATLMDRLRQRLLTWSGHVLSWVDAPDLRCHVVRYEDMLTRPLETFTAAADFLGLATDATAVTRALAFSSIEELQRQERQHGFREAAARDTSFFRKGKAGAWRDVLSESQAASIIRDHRAVMSRFGYVTPAGEPVV